MERKYQIGKYTLFTRTSKKGSDHSIIMVHGLGISSFYFEPVAEILAKKYTIHIPDLPGFGNSEKPGKLFSLKDFSEILNEYLTTLKLKKAILLGNSFGCQVIVDFATRYPGKVQALILVGPTVNPKERSFFKQIQALQKDAKFEPKWQQKEANRDYKKVGMLRIFLTGLIALRDKIEYKLPKINVPTLVVYGSKDPFVPDYWAKEATNLLPKGTLVKIPNKGHTLNSNAPKELAAIVHKFLKG